MPLSPSLSQETNKSVRVHLQEPKLPPIFLLFLLLFPLYETPPSSSVLFLFMGIGLSSLHADRNGSPIVPSKPTLGDLPESCVALILGYMDPPQICKLATLNRTFRGASWADFVWESKLPPNYDALVRKIFGDFPSNLGKRGIYARLCRLNTLDGGTKVNDPFACYSILRNHFQKTIKNQIQRFRAIYWYHGRIPRFRNWEGWEERERVRIPLSSAVVGNMCQRLRI